jgi:hypothetical protein
MVCCIFGTDNKWNCLTFLLLYFYISHFLYCIAYPVYDVYTANIVICVSFLCVIDIDTSNIMTCLISSSQRADIGLM